MVKHSLHLSAASKQNLCGRIDGRLKPFCHYSRNPSFNSIKNKSILKLTNSLSRGNSEWKSTKLYTKNIGT